MDQIHTANQKTYRRLLTAMSRPGRLVRMDATKEEYPFAAALAIGRCLLDAEVSLCVIGDDQARRLKEDLIAATRVRIDTLETADFLFHIGAGIKGMLEKAKRGGLETPEAGATVVVCLEAEPPDPSARQRVRLTGPGIAGSAGIVPELAGIPLSDFKVLSNVNGDYPLGVDAFFVSPNGDLMALPRSTRIQVR